MPDLSEPVVCRFDDFVLDRRAGGLSRVDSDGRRASVPLGSRALQILCLLVDRRGETVSSREIMDVIWGNVAVEPNNLTVQLSALRRVLDADRGQGSCIQNIPGRGYRFVPTVTEMLAGVHRPDTGVGATREDPDTQSAPGEIHDAAQSTLVVELHPPARRWRLYTALAIASCLGIAALLAVAIRPADPRAPSEADATTAPAGSVVASAVSAERPRLSLAVLPFINLGGDGMDDATVDAITEDLTSDLSHASGLFVIARGSAFTYKGKSIDIRRVGEELGVRYVVEGSVRKVDGTLRVNAQLASTETGAQVWADRFGIERDGIGFGVDDIVHQIGHVLVAGIIDSEHARGARERPANPDVADILLHARSLHGLPPNPQRLAEIVALYERAVALDPSSATALAGLAESLLDSISPFSEDPALPEKLRRAEELVGQAELLRPYDAKVMFARAYLLFQRRSCADMLPAAQRLIDAYPNFTSSYAWMGACLMFNGNAAEAIPRIEQSIRLHPRNAYVHTRYRQIGYALLLLGRYDDAVLWFEKSLLANPTDSQRNRGNNHAAIAAAQALAGHTEQARASAAEAGQLWPTITARSYFPFQVTGPVAGAQVARMRAGLRLAGIRDHVDEDADTGVTADEILHTNYEAPTPTTVPGAQTIRTPDLATLEQQRKRKLLLLDTGTAGRSIPGAVGLWGAGIGGSLSDQFQDRLREKMQKLTGGDLNAPVVTIGWNAERYQGRNLALRLVALGYTDVHWYRGGREAWQVAGLPDADLVSQDW